MYSTKAQVAHTQRIFYKSIYTFVNRLRFSRIVLRSFFFGFGALVVSFVCYSLFEIETFKRMNSTRCAFNSIFQLHMVTAQITKYIFSQTKCREATPCYCILRFWGKGWGKKPARGDFRKQIFDFRQTQTDETVKNSQEEKPGEWATNSDKFVWNENQKV